MKNFKKSLFFLIIFSLSIFFISCEKDEDELPNIDVRNEIVSKANTISDFDYAYYAFFEKTLSTDANYVYANYIYGIVYTDKKFNIGQKGFLINQNDSIYPIEIVKDEYIK